MHSRHRPAGFVPRGAVTGIGSLPFVDPDEAIDFVAAHAPQVPFWPELGRRGATGGMLEHALAPAMPVLRAGGPGRFALDAPDVDRFVTRLAAASPEPDEHAAPGFAAFTRAADEHRFAGALALKGQLAGPITLAWSIEVNGRPATESAPVLTALVEHCERSARAQVEVLARYGLPVLVVLDEPALGLVTSGAALPEAPAILATIAERLRAEGAIVGVHCCGAVDAGVLGATDPDVVSFDALLPGGPDAGSRGTLGRAWASGTILAFGLAPTDRAGGPDADGLFDTWAAATRGAAEPAVLARRTIVTARCGLGLSEPADARRSFELAAAVSARIAEVARA